MTTAVAPPRINNAPPYFHVLAKPTGAVCNIAELLRRGRFADEIIPMLAAEDAAVLREAFDKAGRNEKLEKALAKMFKTFPPTPGMK